MATANALRLWVPGEAHPTLARVPCFCDASLGFRDAFHLDTSADGSSVCLQSPSVLILSGFHVLVPSPPFKMPSPARLAAAAAAVFYFIVFVTYYSRYV